LKLDTGGIPAFACKLLSCPYTDGLSTLTDSMLANTGYSMLCRQSRNCGSRPVGIAQNAAVGLPHSLRPDCSSSFRTHFA
jgi:hypothetical protein